MLCRPDRLRRRCKNCPASSINSHRRRIAKVGLLDHVDCWCNHPKSWLHRHSRTNQCVVSDDPLDYKKIFLCRADCCSALLLALLPRNMPPLGDLCGPTGTDDQNDGPSRQRKTLTVRQRSNHKSWTGGPEFESWRPSADYCS